MSYPYFDNPSIIFYLFIGTLCMISVKIAKSSIKYSEKKSVEGFTLLFITLALFATLRKVSIGIGGTDAITYQIRFINYYNHGADRFENTDILFAYYMGVIRYFTSSPYIYRFISYSIISIGYIAYIKKFCPQGTSSIAFICLVYPFLRSFNTMRNSISISFFLFSIISLYDKQNLKSLIFLICSILTHRLSIIMVAFFPFYFIFKKFIISSNRNKLIVFVCIFVLLSYLISVQLQKFIIAYSLFQEEGSADFYYLTQSVGNNILNNWSMFIVHLLLFVAMIVLYKYLPNIRQLNFIKVVFIFDLIMLPATLVLGMWRFTEYFYISNLILWGVMITVLSKKLTYHSTLIMKSLIAMGFYALLYIRVVREWEPASLLPYLFFWQ